MDKSKILIGSGVALVLLLLSKRTKANTNMGAGMLGKYFSYDELIDSPTCESEGIDNTPNADQIANAQALVENVLDPIREYIDLPVIVTSFFRGQECNDEIGGADESKHLEAKAADIVTFKDGIRRNDLILDAVEALDLPFDRLIREKGTFDNPQWIHIEFDRDKPISQQRRQYLRIT